MAPQAETLRDSLAVVRPWLDEQLVEASHWEALLDLAAGLAPIHCAGFEVRLAAGDPAVDLIQRVAGLRGEPYCLAAHVRSAGLDADPAWRRLAAFCDVWSDARSGLHEAVSGVFLEIDAAAPVAGEAPGLPAPSIYLSLQPGAAIDSDRLLALVAAAVGLLWERPLPEPLGGALRRCNDVRPEGCSVTDIGFMLSRRVDAVRLVLAPMTLTAAGELLVASGWPGSVADLDGGAKALPADASDLGLSLDVGAAPLPRVGLELYPGGGAAQGPPGAPSDASGWGKTLAMFEAAGLCSAAKRRALLCWAGHIEPTEVSAEWPASLLVESLLNRPDQFSVLARRPTFVKIICAPGRPAEAKAYIGFGPRSYAPEVDDRPARRQAGPRAADSATANGTGGRRRAARAAIAAGIEYLLAYRRPDGLWREFPRIMQGADEWATAYIGCALAACDPSPGCDGAPAGGADGARVTRPGSPLPAPGMPRARSAAAEAWAALCRRRCAADGWGYNGSLPPDADSTTWALRLAAAVGEGGSPRAAAARRVLDRHLTNEGGVATYEPSAEGGLRSFLGDLDMRGMFAAHTCVSAAAVGVDGLTARLTDFIARRQEKSGRWRGYWWSDDEYTTALAVESLGPDRREQGRRAADWAARRIDRHGAVWSRGLGATSPFATALVIRILARECVGARTDLVAAATDWLLAAQRPDGSWTPSALMRMPPTGVDDGDARPAATCVSVDDYGLFTTATVIRTLAALPQSGP